MAASIAIVIVMLIINSFMVYAIIRTWERVSEKVEKYFLIKTSGLVDDKGITNEDNDDSDKKSIKTNVIYETRELYYTDHLADKTSYKNTDFREDYKTVKKNMDFSKQGIIQEVIAKENDCIDNNCVVNMVEEFDFDTIFQLSTLSSSEQKSILESCLSDSQRKILQDYLHATNREFCIIDFYDYINQLSKREDPNYYVKTGWQNDDFNHLGNNVVTVHDSDITEGVKIVHKDKLYDYSI